ncbi:MAG: hypothetical protein AB7G15_00570 [Alphaproteobacteria bacterium]
MNAPAAPERIIVLTPYIRSNNGHHASMAMAIAEAARKRGLSVDIVVQKGGVDPELIARMGARDLLPPLSIPWVLPDNPARPDYRLSFRLGALFAEHAHVLDPLIDDRPTLIVVDGLQPATFFGLASWLRDRHPDKPVGVLHMAIAFNMIDLQTGMPSSHREVYAALLSAIDDARSDIAVFGRRYQRDFEAFTGQAATYYPMPMDLSDIPRSVPGAERPLTIVVNTASRGSVDAAVACVRDRFVRHHFKPRLKLASWGLISDDDMRRLTESGAPVIGRGITRAEYADVFRTKGALVLAYSALQYRRQTSGVMTEAAAAGLVTVVPAETWMSDCIEEELAAGVAFDGLTGRDLVRALKTVHRRWDDFADLAGRRADDMRRAHSAAPFVDQAIKAFPRILGSARVYGHPAGQRLGFERGEGAHHLYEGWSFAEEWGRWQEGDRAGLRIYVTPADGALRAARPRRLRVEAMGLSPKGGAQAVDVRANGVAIGQCRFDGGARQTFDLPLPAEAQSPDLRLEFHVLHPVRPVDLGINKDARRLGLGLISLTVIEDA